MQSGNLPTSDGLTKTPVHRRLRRRFLWIALTTILLISFYALHSFVFVAAGRWLNVGERLKSPVDCVLVLGGDPPTRPFLAAAIYRAGFTKKAVIIEVKVPSEPIEGALPPDHVLARMVLVKRGVPTEAVEQLAGPVESTRDEAMIFKKFLDANPKLSVAIITSDFHTRRTRLLFRRLLAPHRDRLHFVSCPIDGYNAENWWQSTEGMLRYTTEFAKLFRDFCF